MINSIHIKDYILIDELTVDFSKGLNVITGETGTGKSIIINAIDIALGAKVSPSVIKNNKEKAFIELSISVQNPKISELFKQNELDFDPEIIVSREISQTSSRCRVNGTLVNQTFIKDLKDLLLDIHSQHQTYSFMQPKSHITLLDSYAQDIYGKELDSYKTLYAKYLSLLKSLENAKNSANSTEAQIDFLKFQIQEIEQAEISDPQEEEKLAAELKVLENAEKLKELTYQSYQALNGDDSSIIDALLQVKFNISKAVSMDESLEEIESSIIEVSELAKDLSSRLRDYSSSISADLEKINSIQERLYLFDKLKRKYGSTLEEVLESYEQFRQELASIEFSTKSVEELTQESEKVLSQLNSLAYEISEKRKNCAAVLSTLIQDELIKLELPKARFEIRITPQELASLGFDNVEFYLSTNVSQDLSPLAKTASGGEISRVMLAIKTIFAKADAIDTVIFDEIDTGISGKAAQSVADEISELAKFRQIILITHQAIIASKANAHFLVSKKQDDTTSVDIQKLDEEQKIKAIASLASGDVSDSAIEFAKSLLSSK